MAAQLFKRILQTISYTDQFRYPLSDKEVWLRLLDVATFAEVKRVLTQLCSQQYVNEQKGYYYSVASNQAFDHRAAGELEAQKYHESIAEVKSTLQAIPWVEAVAVTGSLSMGVASASDDLDIMVITQPNRLWLTRLAVVLLSSLKGRRRYWWEDQDWVEKNASSAKLPTPERAFSKPKWCFNLWLTTKTLAVPQSSRSIYTAYEVLQANFVYTKRRALAKELPQSVGQRVGQTVEAQFLMANHWVRQILPQFWQYRIKQASLRQVKMRSSTAWLGFIWWTLDWLLYHTQVWYMTPHMTREKVSRDMAYFHPRPTKKLVSDGWQNSLLTMVATQKKYTKVASKDSMVKKSKNKDEVAEQLHSEKQAIELQTVPFDQEFLDRLKKIQKKSAKIVLVTGVFDLLHYAHRQFLLKARSKGDALLIGVESDVRVRQLKGAGRPIHTQAERQHQLENLSIADLVFILPEQFSQPADHQALIKTIQPRVLAVSANSPHLEEKQKVMSTVGGKVEIVMEHDPSISTTLLLEQMK